MGFLNRFRRKKDSEKKEKTGSAPKKQVKEDQPTIRDLSNRLSNYLVKRTELEYKEGDVPDSAAMFCSTVFSVKCGATRVFLAPMHSSVDLLGGKTGPPIVNVFAFIAYDVDMKSLNLSGILNLANKEFRYGAFKVKSGSIVYNLPLSGSKLYETIDNDKLLVFIDYVAKAAKAINKKNIKSYGGKPLFGAKNIPEQAWTFAFLTLTQGAFMVDKKVMKETLSRIGTF